MDMYKIFALFLELSFIKYGLTQLEARKTEKFEEEFVQFVNDALGVHKFQDYLDTQVSFSTKPFSGTAVLDEIVDAMYTEYKNKLDLVEDLANHMTSIYNELEDEGPTEDILFAPCCADNPKSTYKTWDAQLNQYIKLDMCVHGRGLKTNPSIEILPKAVTDKWRKVFEDEHENGVQWIFYGNEEGILYNYPAVQMCQESYDPRHRPFYIETVTPVPKDIVIVIDRSGSMGEHNNGRSLMAIAQEAASTLIDTLNIHDRVGVVSFSTTAEKAAGNSMTGDCYATNVARATPENKSYLRKFVYNIQTERANHITNYTSGLEAAFQLLNNTPDIKFDKRERSNVILFLTDGKPDDDKSPGDQDEPGNAYRFGGYIYQNISKMNAELDIPAILLTYGLGRHIDAKATEILRNMANQVISETEVTKGNFVHVVEPDNLRREMTSYYNLFTREGGSSETHFTAPYQDNFGSGVVAAICKSVNKGATLKGVICIDQTIEKLLSEMMYRQAAESSYFYMVDVYARVFDHPYAQNPTEITNHPKFLYLDVLEIGDRIDEMISSIVNQVNGNLTTTTRRIVSSGDPYLDSVIYHSAEIHYVWKIVPGTKYVIGLATIASEKEAIITWIDELPKHFIYHKITEESNSAETCLHDRKAVLKDDVGVQFALRAFEVPYKFYVMLESEEMVQSFRDYFTKGTEHVDIGFKTQIREYYAAMSHFRNITLEANKIWKHSILWRFLATENGIFFNFPSTEFPKKYDPTRESWYPLAKANRENIIVTRPDQDSEGFGAVTIAKVIFEGKTGHDSTNDIVIGVMGMNLYHQNIHDMLTKHILDCNNDEYSCFLMDTSGFIITHPNWVSSSFVDANSTIHLAKMEPLIARELIQTSQLKYSVCLNVTEIRHQYSWYIDINEEMADPNFEIHHVEGTNMLLVIKKNGPRGQECFNCRYQDYKLCQRAISQSECFCPCYAYDQDNYQYCEDTFIFNSDDVPICPAPLLKIDSRQWTSDESSLKPCHILDCDDYLTEWTCKHNDKCEWTTKCEKKDECSKESGEILPKDCLDLKEKIEVLPHWAIALIALGILLLIFVLCIICQIVLRVNHLKKNSDNASIYDEMSEIGHDNECMKFDSGEYLNRSDLKNTMGNIIKPRFIQPDLTKEALYGHGSVTDDGNMEKGCRHASCGDIANIRKSRMIIDQQITPAAPSSNEVEKDGQILPQIPTVRAHSVDCNLSKFATGYLTMKAPELEDTNEVCDSSSKSDVFTHENEHVLKRKDSSDLKHKSSHHSIPADEFVSIGHEDDIPTVDELIEDKIALEEILLREDTENYPHDHELQPIPQEIYKTTKEELLEDKVALDHMLESKQGMPHKSSHHSIPTDAFTSILSDAETATFDELPTEDEKSTELGECNFDPLRHKSSHHSLPADKFVSINHDPEITTIDELMEDKIALEAVMKKCLSSSPSQTSSNALDHMLESKQGMPHKSSHHSIPEDAFTSILSDAETATFDELPAEDEKFTELGEGNLDPLRHKSSHHSLPADKFVSINNDPEITTIDELMEDKIALEAVMKKCLSSSPSQTSSNAGQETTI